MVQKILCFGITNILFFHIRQIQFHDRIGNAALINLADVCDGSRLCVFQIGKKFFPPINKMTMLTFYSFNAVSHSGNEIQQLYVCSQLVKALEELEKKGAIAANNEILVIPAVNVYSMNIERRFWALDNTDINRMFPGYSEGETTQRIAGGVFEKVKDYDYGIQFASFYTPGDFVPHVRIMDTGFTNESLSNLFGLPYAVIRKPRPIDTATLNYNWQIWERNAFSVYTKDMPYLFVKSSAALNFT